jgi:hypothetical protein
MMVAFIDEGTPSGIPVGRALAVPEGPYHGDLTLATRLIDRVHGDGALPSIPTTLSPGLGRRGSFVYDTSRGLPIAIRVNADWANRAFNAFHEVGHFLDYSAVGQPGQWASLTEPELGEWRLAVRASRAFRQLKALSRRPSVTVESPTGAREVPVERLAIERLLPIQEFRARSYAQFVTIVTGDTDAIASLDTLRIRLTGELYIPVQWEEDDFVGIAEAIDRLFRRLGWRTTNRS